MDGFKDDVDKEAFARNAITIYNKHYREQMEATERGKVVAIEVESERAFTGRTALEAAMKARQELPNRLYYFIGVGYPYVHSLRSPTRRVSIAARVD